MVSVVKMVLPEDQDPKDLKVQGEKPELLVPMDSQDNVETPVLQVHKEDLALKDLKGHKAREDLLENVVQPDQEEKLDHKDRRENQEEMVCTGIILNAFGSEYMPFFTDFVACRRTHARRFVSHDVVCSFFLNSQITTNVTRSEYVLHCMVAL